MVESALQKLVGSGTGNANNKPSFHTGKCTTYEQCLQTENGSGLAEKLDALPPDNVNLKTRGVIATSDFMIRTSAGVDVVWQQHVLEGDIILIVVA